MNFTVTCMPPPSRVTQTTEFAVGRANSNSSNCKFGLYLHDGQVRKRYCHNEKVSTRLCSSPLAPNLPPHSCLTPTLLLPSPLASNLPPHSCLTPTLLLPYSYHARSPPRQPPTPLLPHSYLTPAPARPSSPFPRW